MGSGLCSQGASGEPAAQGGAAGEAKTQRQPVLQAQRGVELAVEHVAAHQLKSVPGRVIEGDLRTESGVELGGFFAHMSIFNRIVMSVYKLGTTNALIDAGSREVARIYFEE